MGAPGHVGVISSTSFQMTCLISLLSESVAAQNASLYSSVSTGMKSILYNYLFFDVGFFGTKLGALADILALGVFPFIIL